jgi:biopolymer transport protein ExbD
MNTPHINVTPLIDVLLVLLIIFMVVAPLKPSAFKARIPAEPKPITGATSSIDTLVVSVTADSILKLNGTSVGNTNDTSQLVALLKNIFDARIANGNVSASFASDPERPVADSTERTVFVKAPRSLNYGSVARVVDAVKLGGAFPIALQLDGLD